MKGVFNSMSRPNTCLQGIDYNVVWYVLNTTKAVASKIPDQESSLSKSLFLSQKYVQDLL